MKKALNFSGLSAAVIASIVCLFVIGYLYYRSQEVKLAERRNLILNVVIEEQVRLSQFLKLAKSEKVKLLEGLKNEPEITGLLNQLVDEEDIKQSILDQVGKSRDLQMQAIALSDLIISDVEDDLLGNNQLIGTLTNNGDGIDQVSLNNVEAAISESKAHSDIMINSFNLSLESVSEAKNAEKEAEAVLKTILNSNE